MNPTQTIGWGASAAAWRCLSEDVLGGLWGGGILLPDLRPVVSNPHAKISPNSKIAALGKVPTMYDNERKVVGVLDWNKIDTTWQNIQNWMSQPDYGICVTTRKCLAIDVDVIDKTLSNEVIRILTEVLDLDTTWVRWRADSFKFLLPVFTGETLRYTCINLGDTNQIEFLAFGQQFVAVGTNPSGYRYQWSTLRDYLVARDDVFGESVGAEYPPLFKELTPQALLELWAELSKLGVAKGLTAKTSNSDGESKNCGSSDEDRINKLYEMNAVIERDHRGAFLIHCPWKNEHTLDSGDTQTVYFPIGADAPEGKNKLGRFVCLHAHCRERSIAEWDDKIGLRTSYFEPVGREIPADAPKTLREALIPKNDLSLFDSDFRTVGDKNIHIPNPGEAVFYHVTDKGKVPMNFVENVIAIVDNPRLCQHVFRYDKFTDTVFINAVIASPYGGDELVYDKETWRVIENSDYTAITRIIERFGSPTCPPAAADIRMAIAAAAERCSYDSVTEYVNQLPCDVPNGRGRIATFLQDYAGVEMPLPGSLDFEATAMMYKDISEYLFTSMIGRALDPGCKADMCLVLVGGQGARKTEFVKHLSPFPQWRGKFNPSVQGGDGARAGVGVWVAEWPEMIDGDKVHLQEAIKDSLSDGILTYRKLYKEEMTRYKRRMIVVGTSNNYSCLVDPTGSRRYLVVTVRTSCNVEMLKRDIHLLLGEALQLYQDGGVRWAAAEIAGRQLNVQHTRTNPTRNAIYRHLTVDSATGVGLEITNGFCEEKLPDTATLEDVMTHALNLKVVQQTPTMVTVATNALMSLGYEKAPGRRGADGLFILKRGG